MQPTVYQKPEIRDANDNIIQQGAFGKNTALANATNDGWIDYVANDLEFLYDLAKDEIVPVPSLPASGQTNKTYLLTTTGVSYRWSGTEWVAVSSSEAVGRAETAANLAEQWATKTDGTVDGTEYSAKYYAQQAEASADDAQDTADDMADHLVQIDKNTGGVSKNSKRISNIEKLLQGNLYDYDTDDDSAYVKTVPSGALPYAGVEKIGGKTIVYNQLVNPANIGASKEQNGITFTNNGDGSVTVSGTATDGTAWLIAISSKTWEIHKYYVRGCPAGGSVTTYRMTLYGMGGDVTENGNGIIWNPQSRMYKNLTINIAQGTDLTTPITFKPIFIDLTLMFGAGNEPTLEQCNAMFPSDLYPYNAGTLLSAGVTSVVSKDSNDDALQTLSIPAEVRALEGYGWSAGTAYNYVGFERKVFVQNVGRVDLGTLSWTRSSTESHEMFYSTVTNIKETSATNVKGNTVCSAYINDTYGSVYNHSADKIIGVSNTNHRVGVYDANMVSLTAGQFKTAMSGVYAYYELATPIETDISQYLTDNLIEVGAGGTLTFPNANGDDYHIPVPSTETYMIDLQEAIENGN